MWGVWQVQSGHGEREISKGADDVRTSLLCHTHFVQGSATSRPPSQLSGADASASFALEYTDKYYPHGPDLSLLLRVSSS